MSCVMSYHVIIMEIGNPSRIIIDSMATVWRNTRPLLQCQLSFQLVRQLPGAGHSGHRTLIVSVELIKDDKRCANCRASDCVSRCQAACGALSYSERYHLYLCVYPLHTVYLCSVSVFIVPAWSPPWPWAWRCCRARSRGGCPPVDIFRYIAL